MRYGSVAITAHTSIDLWRLEVAAMTYQDAFAKRYARTRSAGSGSLVTFQSCVCRHRLIKCGIALVNYAVNV